MLKEFVISFAQIIQAGFAFRCTAETILRTFSVAGKQEFAFLALGGERLVFHVAEVMLAFTVHHFHQCLIIDVSQFIFGENEVVARIYITVEFHNTGVSASFAIVHIPGCSPIQFARVESNICM